MKPLFYIMKRSIINHIKKLTKKPLHLILYIILILAFVGFLVMSFIMPNQNITKSPKFSFSLISTMFVLTVTYLQLNQGIEKGSSFFRQSDVNLLFTAPISPKKVLVYGFIKQMFATFVMIFFIAFQIPNLKNYYQITSVGILIIFLSIFTLFFSISLLSLIIYSITSKKHSYRSNAKKILNAFYLCIIVWIIINLLKTKDLITTAENVFESKTFNMIPFVGWFKVVSSYATKEIDSIFIFNALFIIVSIIILIIILYKTNTDYYEDVLGATERKEKMYAAKKSGNKVKEIKVDKIRKINQGFGSGGAKAIFYKHLIEYRKNGMFFIGKESIGIVAFGIMSKYFMPHSSIATVLYFSIYMLFIFSMQGKWIEEMQIHYIYIIPANSIEKVFYGTLANHLKNLVDGIILFGIAGFLFKSDIITIILCAITYTTYGAIFVYTDVLARRIFGSTHGKIFKFFMKLIIIILIITPAFIGASLITYTVLKGASYASYSYYIILALYNIIISFLLILSGKKIFEVAEI